MEGSLSLNKTVTASKLCLRVNNSIRNVKMDDQSNILGPVNPQT